MRTFFYSIFRFFASYGLAVAIFFFFFLLILFGTLYQVDHGIYQAQKKYFESLFLIQPIGPIAVPLPGGYLLMVLLAINLICGGIIRLPKNWRRPGVLIAHVGVLVLLASAGVTYYFSQRGHMMLYPNQESNEFADYYKWDIEVGKPAAGASLHLISDEDFKDLGPNESRTFYSEDLPFDVTVSGYARNAAPRPVDPDAAGSARVVDGYRLVALPPAKDAETNAPGVYVTVTDKMSGEVTDGILWGMATEPVTVKSGDTYYTLGLERKRYRVPFTVHLDDFKAQFHPGTMMASSYESHVTKRENGQEEKIRIWMNHPLRDRGYTFFQASYGPPNAPPGTPMYTVLEVVRNPADQWPLVATIIIAAGFVIHFTQKLLRYMRAETRRRTA